MTTAKQALRISELIASDDELQDLIRTKDVEAAGDEADAGICLTHCYDEMDLIGSGLEIGPILDEKVRANGDPDCAVFKLTMSTYGDDDDMVFFWVGRRDQVRARLEALPDRVPEADPRRGDVGIETAYELGKRLRNGLDLPLQLHISERDFCCYEAFSDIGVTWEDAPDAAVIYATGEDTRDAQDRQGVTTTRELGRRLQAGPNRLVQLRIDANGGRHYGCLGRVGLDHQYKNREHLPSSAILSAPYAESEADAPRRG